MAIRRSFPIPPAGRWPGMNSNATHPAKALGEFIKHTAYDKPFMGEGVGFGDINGDGRGDFVTSMGWVEAPADRRSGQWIVHEEFKLPGHQGVPMLVYDVNGDGRRTSSTGWGMTTGCSGSSRNAAPTAPASGCAIPSTCAGRRPMRLPWATWTATAGRS